ncbi:cell wall-binding repeat-containing protein [Dehalobacter sp. TeCB1]|uniref:cell wall-binding repeat-containing protein n=1 Tax=Dehalobacter sp. TeCB1 TaxID=1843715 RepID=UPI00083B88FE|nr:cell wall-binding repeat-containing protein [Dehalobacter sp. TeCB1]OCZ49688.1 glycoside hydrolase [Dehalobacter sp. TeCB1]
MSKLKMNSHQKKQATSLVRKGIATLTLASFFTCSLFMGTGETPKSAYAADSSTTSFTRFAGETRYETAVEISSNNWTNASSVVLTRGDAFPDALAGAVLANSAVVGGGPLLLTESNRLRPEVLQEIQRLNASSVFILGGTGAISASVENALKTSGLQTYRIQGNDRYETAANIAATSIESSTRAFLASGKVFADALSISSYAAANGIPLLLTDTQKVPTATLNALQKLGVTEITLIGGESAISASVAGQLKTAGYTVSRLSDQDRYKTNVAILKNLPYNMDKMVVATGGSFPDALAGSVLAARNNNPILLVPKDENALLNTPTTAYLGSNRASVNNFFFLGGFDVISTAIQNIVRIGSTSSKISLQFWDGYANKTTYENQLSYVPGDLADYIDILVPNLCGAVQADGSFAYRFSSAETPKYLVSLGQSKGAQVVPMVMSSGSTADSVLQNATKRSTFVNSSLKLIAETNADGILVDMEALSESSEEGLTALMQDLYTRLHPQGKLVMVSVMSKTSETAQPWYDEYDYSDLAQYVDYIQIMSYDKHYSTSAPGPIAPLDWVREVIAYAVTEIPSEKILMGVPYYGRAWRTEGSGWVSKVFGWAVATQTADQFCATITRETTLTDPIGVPTFQYVDESGYNRTAYFDDRLSWGEKLDIMDEYNLGGIGGWSMGWINEVSTPELYPLLKERIN